MTKTVQLMVESLRAQVAAAKQEFDLALIFHSVWKPSAYDEDLLSRMGPSFAAHAFLVIRTALQREMLLALTRLWDNDKSSVRLVSIGNILKDRRVIASLVDESAERMAAQLQSDTSSWFRSQVERSIGGQVKDAIALIDAYTSDEELRTALANLKFLRDKVLAHRQVKEAAIPEKTATREQIDRFMTDMTKLMGLLSSIAHATAYDPRDTAKIYDYYAELYWMTARGERTEGHPKYRAPPGALAETRPS